MTTPKAPKAPGLSSTDFGKCVARGDCSGAKAALKTFQQVGKQTVSALRAAGQKDFARTVAQTVKAQVAEAKSRIAPCKIVRKPRAKKTTLPG